jgi:hypothetical protein
MKNFLGILVLFTAVVLSTTSCKKNREAKASITVLRKAVDIISGDTIQEPVVQASVRFYLDIQLAEHIDTTILTDTKGKAEFVWFEDAIIQYDVVAPPDSEIGEYLILEQGETVEKTIVFEI